MVSLGNPGTIELGLSNQYKPRQRIFGRSWMTGPHGIQLIAAVVLLGSYAAWWRMVGLRRWGQRVVTRILNVPTVPKKCIGRIFSCAVMSVRLHFGKWILARFPVTLPAPHSWKTCETILLWCVENIIFWLLSAVCSAISSNIGRTRFDTVWWVRQARL